MARLLWCILSEGSGSQVLPQLFLLPLLEVGEFPPFPNFKGEIERK